MPTLKNLDIVHRELRAHQSCTHKTESDAVRALLRTVGASESSTVRLPNIEGYNTARLIAALMDIPSKKVREDITKELDQRGTITYAGKTYRFDKTGCFSSDFGAFAHRTGLFAGFDLEKYERFAQPKAPDASVPAAATLNALQGPQAPRGVRT